MEEKYTHLTSLSFPDLPALSKLHSSFSTFQLNTSILLLRTTLSPPSPFTLLPSTPCHILLSSPLLPPRLGRLRRRRHGLLPAGAGDCGVHADVRVPLRPRPRWRP